MATTSICKLQVLLGCVYILLPCIYIHQEYPLGGMYLDRDNRLTVLDSQMPKKSMFNLIPFPPMLSLVNSSLLICPLFLFKSFYQSFLKIPFYHTLHTNREHNVRSIQAYILRFRRSSLVCVPRDDAAKLIFR